MHSIEEVLLTYPGVEFLSLILSTGGRISGADINSFVERRG
jgi:hypothetical protein